MNTTRSINTRLAPLMVHCRETVQNAVRRTFKSSYGDQLGWVSETVQNAVRRTFKPSYGDQLGWVMGRVLQCDSCCIDVGARRGQILRDMIRLAPQGRHHAIEALPNLANKLKQDYPAAVIHTTAVGNKIGVSTIHQVENAPGSSGLRPRKHDGIKPNIAQIQVPVTTLDEIIPSNQKITFIKMDIEGGEYHAMQGAQRIIRDSRPYIAFESHIATAYEYGVLAPMMYELLDRLNYDIFTVKNWLGKQPATTLDSFVDNWVCRQNFSWLAIPR